MSTLDESRELLVPTDDEGAPGHGGGREVQKSRRSDESCVAKERAASQEEQNQIVLQEPRDLLKILAYELNELLALENTLERGRTVTSLVSKMQQLMMPDQSSGGLSEEGQLYNRPRKPDLAVVDRDSDGTRWLSTKSGRSGPPLTAEEYEDLCRTKEMVVEIVHIDYSANSPSRQLSDL